MQKKCAAFFLVAYKGFTKGKKIASYRQVNQAQVINVRIKLKKKTSNWIPANYVRNMRAGGEPIAIDNFAIDMTKYQAVSTKRSACTAEVKNNIKLSDLTEWLCKGKRTFV